MKLIRGDEEFQAVLDELVKRPINYLLSYRNKEDFWENSLGLSQGGSNHCNIESLELLHDGVTREFWAIMWDYSDDEFNYCVIDVMKKTITDNLPDPHITKEVT